MKLKRTFRLPVDVIDQLAEFAMRRRVGQPDVVEAALRSFMSPDNPEQLEAALKGLLPAAQVCGGGIDCGLQTVLLAQIFGD